jgi:hypothetical protein
MNNFCQVYNLGPDDYLNCWFYRPRRQPILIDLMSDKPKSGHVRNPELQEFLVFTEFDTGLEHRLFTGLGARVDVFRPRRSALDQ